MKLTADDRVHYARAVWQTFQHQAKTKRDMSNAEYLVISRWMDKGLPLPVVLRGITEFNGKPRRLEACVDGVNKSVAYWHQAMGGVP